MAHYKHIGDPIYLRTHRLFVAEGRLVVARLLSSRRWTTDSVLVTPAAYESLAAEFANSASAAPVFVVDQALMNGLAGFNIHRGCLALARRPDERPREVPQGFGSGFVVDPKGYVLTNNHVVEGAEQVEVTLTDGRKFTSKDIKTDPKTDLALVKIDNKGEALPFMLDRRDD